MHCLYNKIITLFLKWRYLDDKKVDVNILLQDALVALRLISNQHQRVIHFRDIRPHLLAESATYEQNSEVTDVPRGTLKVCGFVRGRSLSVNRLVHLPGYGDFQMSQVNIHSVTL